MTSIATSCRLTVPSPSRVCARCGLGLIVSAAPDGAPTAADPFLLVDGQLSICAVSRLAEQLLLTSETEVVNSHIGDLLVPADVEIGGPESLVNLIVQRHGGCIWAEGAPGRGSIFRFTLASDGPG